MKYFQLRTGVPLNNIISQMLYKMLFLANSPCLSAAYCAYKVFIDIIPIR